MVASINLSPPFAAALTFNAFRELNLLAHSKSATDLTLDLEDLNAHGKSEHDASLTRLNAIQGDTLNVNTTMVQQILDDATQAGQTWIDTRSMGRTRSRRDNESLAAGSPPLNSNDTTTCLNEAGLVILLIGVGGLPGDGGDTTVWDQRRAKVESVQEWLDFERFPSGWMRSETVLTAEGDMVPLAGRVEIWKKYWRGQEGEQ